MRYVLVAMLVAPLLGGCASGVCHDWCPNTSLSAQELAGARAAQMFEPQYGGVVRNAQAEARMARIGKRLARVAEGRSCPDSFRYRLLASSRVNAASLPVGRIYVTRGLYEHLVTDELLAAVLAHEMSHLTADDCFKPRCKSLDESLERERCADVTAVAVLTHAGFEPAALSQVVHMIADLQPEGWIEARCSAISAATMRLQASAELDVEGKVSMNGDEEENLARTNHAAQSG